MSTVKIFVLIVIVFVVVVLILAGPNPFSFGEAYFRPRSNSSVPAPLSETVVVNESAAPDEVRIDR